jgi:hypothetical protein
MPNENMPSVDRVKLTVPSRNEICDFATIFLNCAPDEELTPALIASLKETI